jgi:hypothetical protein
MMDDRPMLARLRAENARVERAAFRAQLALLTLAGLFFCLGSMA